MTELFTSPELDKHFKTDGYCVVKNLFTQQTLKLIEDNYFRLEGKAGLDIPFSTTHWSSNDLYRREVHQSVSDLVFPVVTGLLPNYKNILGYYLVKKHGGENKTTIHQDWTLCDETVYTGITLWCPLIDVNIQNGCFQVVKGSHQFYGNIRGTNIESPYNSYGSFIEEKYLTSLELKKGDAVFFDHRLLHASPPNISEKIRIAVGMVLLPKSAEVEHYIKEGEIICKYQCDENFLLSSFYNYRNPEKAMVDKNKYRLVESKPFIKNNSSFQELTKLFNRL
jgi:ectoine hydroxylase-related dioxygenase (phytanoyl-CoA dioxygenase family)